MLTAAARARLTVVLAGARNPSNIGAAARAMRDFGFSDLRFVNEYTAPFEAAQLEAVSSAVAAGDVMRRARAFGTLAEAVADCSVVAGTTAIGERALTLPVHTLAESASRLLRALQASASNDGVERVALVFGSEKTGLTNDQLSHCSLLLTIPLIDPAAERLAADDLHAEDGPLASNSQDQPRHLSMNLGQSVAVCLYELSRGGLESGKQLPAMTGAAATGQDRERLTALLLQAMQVSDYARRFPANAREHVVRRLAQQLGTSHEEVMMWMGFLKMVARQKSESPVNDEAF